MAALAIALSLALVGCGVPISAEEMAKRPLPTQEGGGEELQVQGRTFGVTQETVSTPIPTSVAGSGTPTADSAADSTLAAAAATSTPTPANGTPSATATTANGAAAAIAGSTATLTPAPSATPPPAATAQELAAQAVQIINTYRASLGLRALTADPALAKAAADYAKLMADNNWWSCSCDVHRGPDGSSPGGRVAAAGFDGAFTGEALAGGQATAQDAVNTWLNSAPHRAILLNANATHVGIGYYYKAGWPGHHWVLITGTK